MRRSPQFDCVARRRAPRGHTGGNRPLHHVLLLDADGVAGVARRFDQRDPGSCLVEESKQLDLLVMGSRGYGPRSAVLLGSASGHVVHRAYCPVVVVPRGADERTAP
jgi:nucleotide-binding universal stress UspA family protein